LTREELYHLALFYGDMHHDIPEMKKNTFEEIENTRTKGMVLASNMFLNIDTMLPKMCLRDFYS